LAVSWPEKWRLNDIVIYSKRCIPDFAAMSALDLRQHLQGQREITITRTPLANAMELQQEIEAHGFFVDIRNE
ncbi:MAG: hypothetical protein ACAI34_09075, partial [Verrucomicrobium sp.]